jgi:hypothetical protein
MTIDSIPVFISSNYEIFEWRHATAILEKDYPNEWQDIISVLNNFRLRKSDILTPGGGKSPIAQVIDKRFHKLGWKESSFRTRVVVDEKIYDSPTHKVDNYKNSIGIEVEWNNKDPFYDRDLNNFRLLFDLRVISVGVIITRSDELQHTFDLLGKGSSYGQSTTHMRKLLPRLEGGGGGGCPILVFGITNQLYLKNE